jgi:hypothetical protein
MHVTLAITLKMETTEKTGVVFHGRTKGCAMICQMLRQQLTRPIAIWPSPFSGMLMESPGEYR